MNHKERVVRALNHQLPDRVPVDYWGTSEVTDELCGHFDLKDYEGLLKKLNIDIRYVKPTYKGEKFKEQPDGSLHREYEVGKYVDIWGVGRKRVGNYLEVDESPLVNAATVEEIENYNSPSPDDFDYQSVARKCEEHKDYAIICTGDRLTTRASVFKLAMYLRGMDKLLMDLVLSPRLVDALVNKLLEFHLGHNRRIFREAAGKIDIFMLGDDFGTQNGPMISLDMFRRFFKPALKKLINLGHDFGLKVMLHSCGSVKVLIPEFIEIGLDILNPIQTRAKDMDPKALKKEFGKYLCFHGSIDAQNTLPFGTIDKIREEVREYIDTLAPGGGFILSPSHNIQPGTPVDNIIALYETAGEADGKKG